MTEALLPIFKDWATAQNLFALGCFGNRLLLLSYFIWDRKAAKVHMDVGNAYERRGRFKSRKTAVCKIIQKLLFF